MSLLSVPWVRFHYVQGLVTTAGVGSESLLCTTRATLLDHLERVDEDLLVLLWQDLLSALQLVAQKERLTIPAFEVLCFLLENDVWGSLRPRLLKYVYSLLCLSSPLIEEAGARCFH